MEKIFDDQLSHKGSYNDCNLHYDDALLPDDFQQIAQAYSKSLKNKGFVFIRLEEEEFNLLLSEVLSILSKMKACIKKLKLHIDCTELKNKLEIASQLLEEKFGKKHTYSFSCIENENMAFLSLVSLENLLIIKLMLLSVKSGEIELCNNIITSISGVFAEGFSCEGFKVE